jgi:hypothetical protein
MKKVLNGILAIALVWVIFAISFDVYIGFLEFNGQHEKTLEISNWLDSHFRGNS